jgi:hypothetical protein
LTRGKVQVTSLDDQLWLTRDNIKIKMVIIIVLKYDLGVNTGEDQIDSHKS